MVNGDGPAGPISVSSGAIRAFSRDECLAQSEPLVSGMYDALRYMTRRVIRRGTADDRELPRSGDRAHLDGRGQS